MKRILINFGDNDFGNTFRAVMALILEWRVHDSDKWVPSKEELRDMLNEMLFSTYMLVQHRPWFGGKIDHLREYLTVREDQILYDDEVDTFLMQTGMHNGEAFYVDFENNASGSV